MQEIRPQPGPQEAFLASPADIVVYGGGAYGGKTWSLLVEPLRHVSNPRFGSVTFRRTSVEIRQQGGLWDASSEIYPLLGATSREQPLDWTWPNGARVRFAHMEHEKDRFAWKGAEIPLLAFDQLETFTGEQFWYLVSRNRTTCGVRPYIRATCNPLPDMWLTELVDWWIDPETGYAIDERSGIIRWLIRMDDDLFWADTREELLERYGADQLPLSFTFIRARPSDNLIGQEKDPSYMAKLAVLPRVERERLERGNWKIRPSAGLYFRREDFEMVDVAPPHLTSIRAWDLAATEAKTGTDPDWTVGIRLGALSREGPFYVEDVRRFRSSPHKVEQRLQATAKSDGEVVSIHVPQDPGAAGKAMAQYLVRQIQGYTIRYDPVSGDKIVRAGPISSQCEAGNVKVVRGQWNDAFFNEIENFPDGAHDDQVDAFADAYTFLIAKLGHGEPRIRML